MTEAGKLGLLRAAGAGDAAEVSPLVAKVRFLAEGEGPAKRWETAREGDRGDGF